MNKLNIAYVEPELSGHKLRGTGIYSGKLFESLQIRTDIDIRKIRLHDPFDGFDLVHYPYFDPFFLTLPFVKKIKTVITVHDLIPLKYPKYFPKGVKGFIKWQIQKKLLGSADAILTDSQASERDITNIAGISKEKISIIPLGVNEEFKKLEKSETLKVKNKFNLPDKYLLYVGDINYNKNIPGLLHSYSRIRKEFPRISLVLVGEGFVRPSPSLTDIKLKIRSLNIENAVHILGNVDLKDLVGLYNLATLYVQLSFDEGFGLPVLDALPCGCPVLCSKEGSLPEIAGDSAILVNPYDPEEMHKQMLFAINGDHKTMVEKGMKRAKSYTWKKCSDATVEVYKRLFS